MPEPFFKPSRDTWYVELHGKQHSLGRHPANAPPPKRSRKGGWIAPSVVQDAYHKLMAAAPEPAPVIRAGSVIEIIDKYLAWCQQHRSPATYDFYRWRLQLFCNHLKKQRIAQLLVHELKAFHLDEFLATQPGWSNGTRFTACRALLRVLRWAAKKQYIDRNPIPEYEKPKPGKRTVVISPAEFERILALAGNDKFRDLLEITWETAARPQESLIVEARHVDLEHARWVFPPDESKGEQWPRIVYLNDRALEITRQLMLKHTDGVLLRNCDGAAWDPWAVNSAFIRVQLRMGLQKVKELGLAPDLLRRFNRHSFTDPAVLRLAKTEHKEKVAARSKAMHRLALAHAPKYCLYNLRHSWLDRALKSGIDALTCAIIMGHRDPSTLAKVYQHLSQSPAYLQESLRKVRA